MHSTNVLPRIRDKVRDGESLSLEDGVALFEHRNLLELGVLANEVRERLHGDRTYFNRNLHINATNVCEASCRFCSFARLEEGKPGAYTMSHAEAWGKLQARLDAKDPITEIHIVNGLHPGLPFTYYTELLAGLKRLQPSIHLKAFTAVELHYFAKKYGMTYAEILTKLRDAGMDSIPGGGAEIFAARVRKKICDDKCTGDEWLEVHRTAHRLGLRSNCTMLYGTIETLEERVDHMLRLRALQAETGGFQTFIPLAFHPDNNALMKLPGPTGVEDLRTYAVARLLLDNIPHIKAYWIMLGVKTAQSALWFGADDLDGTVQEEKIYHMAGAETPQTMSPNEIVRIIQNAGRAPVERDTLYNVIAEGDALVSEKPFRRDVRRRGLKVVS
ncbi:MAG TPA: aminofutalosine synthase MqnE [Polyangia bacterium]|jgi:aminodeoxyfutalosine synthase|nr:aminofutalosine synthase MqnE [Polyangia bacterium]